jgi:hypothetical protein
MQRSVLIACRLYQGLLISVPVFRFEVSQPFPGQFSVEDRGLSWLVS